MKVLIERSLRDYLALGDETTKTLLDDRGPLVEAIEEFSRFYESELWREMNVPIGPLQMFLSMNAYMIWLSAVRMAFTGHAAAAFPLFRTALESACYAFLIKDDESLGDIWLQRHDGRDARKRARKAFNSAVTDAARKIDALSGHGDIGRWIIDTYDNAIDYGAHPNAKSVIGHLTKPEDVGEHIQINLIGLYDFNSFETKRSLVACLDYGQVVATVVAFGLGEPTDELNRHFHRLNEVKEAAVAKVMGLPKPETEEAPV